MFKSFLVNIPLVNALLEMPGYAKFMKEFVTKKRRMELETVEVSHSFNTIMSTNGVINKDDPDAFTIPYTIEMYQFTKALCYLSATINLIPFFILKNLWLDAPNTITMCLLMADRSIKRPIGVLYYILVKVDKFSYPLSLLSWIVKLMPRSRLC